MRLDAKTSGVRGEFRRADNGQVIRWVRWYDDVTHVFEAFRYDPQIAGDRGVPLRSILYQGRCELVFRETAVAAPKPSGRIAPATPLAEIKREILKGGEVRATPIVYVPGAPLIECMEPKCHQAAAWSVATERIVEPERGDDGKLYERAIAVDVHCWCNRHYRAPIQISARGVESEVPITRARPQ